MFNRSEIKHEAKQILKNNYWPTVIAGVITTIAGLQLFTTRITQDGRVLFQYNWLSMPKPIYAVLAIIISVFFLSVLEVGGCRYFINNKYGNADAGDLIFGFRSNYYGNIVKVMLMMKIKVFLWSLLFIIPGIVKAYQYYMIPYILAENPEMSSDEVFAMTKEMTTGQKMDLFVFDLSFILWIILGVLTVMIGAIFYVDPYMFQSKANLYLTMKNQQWIEAEAW